MRKRKNASHIVADSPPGNTGAPANVTDIKGDYLKVLRHQTKIGSNLLGSFSADGKYSLSDEKVLQTLINLPKHFDEKVDNVVYCHSNLGAHILNFKVEFQIDPSYSKAELKFIEIEHRFDEDVKHDTTLANTLEPYSPKFRDSVLTLWNIQTDQEQRAKDDFLQNILDAQKHDYDFTRELTEILAQLYVMRMLKLLDGLGELGEKIKADYKLLVEKIIQIDPSIMQDNTRLKQILDRVILKHKAFDKILEVPEAGEILSGYSAPLKNVLGRSAPVKKVEVTTNENKTVEKKAPEKPAPAKKKSKAKSGGSKPWVFDMKNVPKTNYSPSGSTPKPPEKPAPKKEEEKKEEKDVKGNNAKNEDDILKDFLSFQESTAKTLDGNAAVEENEINENGGVSIATKDNVSEQERAFTGEIVYKEHSVEFYK